MSQAKLAKAPTPTAERNKGGRGHLVDKAGQRFGKLLVLKRTDERMYAKRYPVYLVRCDCGAEKKVATNTLSPPGSWHSCGAPSCRRKKEPAPSRYCRCGCKTLLVGRRQGYLPEHRPQQSWTEVEDANLRDLYHRLPIAQVAAAIGRPLDATYSRARLIGIHRRDDMESQHAACIRTGTDRRTLKKRLAAIGIQAGYVEKDGQRFSARVRKADVDRAMALALQRATVRCGTCGGEGHNAQTCPVGAQRAMG